MVDDHLFVSACDGGGGGGYAKAVNLNIPPGTDVTYYLGLGGSGGGASAVGSTGGDTFFNRTGGNSTTCDLSTMSVCAKGGGGGLGAGAGGAGGVKSNGVTTNCTTPDCKAGGGSGHSSNPPTGGGGGGGAGGDKKEVQVVIPTRTRPGFIRDYGAGGAERTYEQNYNTGGDGFGDLSREDQERIERHERHDY